jgi:phosphoglycerate dehydrogenase-like enzyme
MRLLFCGSGWLPVIDLIAARLPAGSSIALWHRAAPLAASVAEIDVLLPSNARITAEVIAAAPNLRLIQQPAAGTENIDLAAAAARGIPVCNAPGTNQIAVAEHALFLLLALARRLPAAQRQFAARELGVPIGMELAGKTLGIIGMGHSGTALAGYVRALGMEVLALGRGATLAARRTFFAGCDAISIHCPLSEATRGLVGADAFAAMRPGALLINCARGGVIDREALVAALASGKLGGVALDVHWHEPADPADPLYADPRVLALPHIAGSTGEALGRVVDVIVDNLDRITRGDALVHRLT